MGSGWLLPCEVVRNLVSTQRTVCLSKFRFGEGDVPAAPGSAIGDKINNFTGGRMSWLVDGARNKQDDKRTGVDEMPKIHGNESDGTNEHLHSNGHVNGETTKKPAKPATKHAEAAKSSATGT
jgi:hypothetical protein